MYPFNPAAIKVPEVQEGSDDEQSTSSETLYVTIFIQMLVSLPQFQLVQIMLLHPPLLLLMCQFPRGVPMPTVLMLVVGLVRQLEVTHQWRNSHMNKLHHFQIRYEEGFNVFTDLDYVKWLEQYHPESLPTDHCALISAENELRSF